jgi:trans-aconitate methyltransferase
VLDYGCGTGSTSPLLQNVLGTSSVIGVDTSKEEIALAKRNAGSGLSFATISEFKPDGDVDVAYCNGVFHHVPLNQRAEAIEYIRSSLRPGGIFSFWENNPWNPGTRLVMSRIPFDRDAILVSAREARRLARAGGFEVLSTHFLFVFPKMLRALRKLERPLSSLPLGAQYQVLCRK